MSKKTDKSAPQPTASAPQAGPNVMINAQYVKDFSFENPYSPIVLSQIKAQPNVAVAIDLKADGLGQDRYEVALHVSVKTKADDKVIYIAELVYAAIATIQNVPKENIEPVLMVYVPGLLFPFARRIIADMTREAGLHPLMLDPIDFQGLYIQKKAAKN